MGSDNWAVYSQDGSLAAHFEHTVAVTADGPRILTPWHELRTRAPASAAGRPASGLQPDGGSLAAATLSAGRRALPSPGLGCRLASSLVRIRFQVTEL